MKVPKNTFGILLVSLSLFLTGCYTQLQNLDYSSPSDRGIHKDYYSWGGSDNATPKSDLQDSDAPASIKTTTTSKAITEEEVVTEDDLVENGIYYKDYETADWYEENYADKIFWDGYDEGFNDGYDEGFEDANYQYWDAHFYSLRSLNRRAYSRIGMHFGWRSHLAFSYQPYYYNDPFWYGFHDSYFSWGGFRYPTWGFYDPYFDPFFYGGWGHYGNPYRSYLVVYNDYHRVNRTRSGTHYNGPRSTGLASRGNGIQNAGITRSRGSSDTIQSKNTGRSGSSIVNTGRTRANSGTTSRYTGRTRTSTSSGNSAVTTGRSNRSQSKGVTNNTRTNRTRSTGVTNRNRSNNGISSVRNNSSSRTRSSSGVQSSSNRSGGNNRSVRSNNSGSTQRSTTVRSRTGSSGRSTVRSNSGSSRTRSSGSNSSTSRNRSRSGN